MRNYLDLIVRNQYKGMGGAYYHRHDWLTVFENRVGSKSWRVVPEACQRSFGMNCIRYIVNVKSIANSIHHDAW